MHCKVKTLNFNRKRIYVGIDVHFKSWKVTIMLEDTFYIIFSMDSSAKELKRYLEREFPGGEYFSTYEAGFCGFSTHRQLEELGIKNIIVNPADIPTTDKDRRQYY